MEPKTAYIVSLIGGIGHLLAGVIFLMGGSLLAAVGLGGLTLFPAIWFLLAGGVTLWAAGKMKSGLAGYIKKGGIICIVTGILAPNLITLIGGILGVVASNN